MMTAEPAFDRMPVLAKANRIKEVNTEYYRVPLEEVLVDASHGSHTHFELIVCRIQTQDGLTGVGYTYTGGKGGHAIAALIEYDLKPYLCDSDSENVEAVTASLLHSHHYIGRGGLLSFAVSAVDIALWDLRCKRVNKPLHRFLGAVVDSTPCYEGLIDLSFSLQRLEAKVRQSLASGHRSIKTKVGSADMQDDVRRIALIRELIGPEGQLMVDANYGYDEDKAIAFGNEIKEFDVLWFEEPVSPDEFEAYGRIANAQPVPLAMGENLHLYEEFERAIRYSNLTYLQPDASNIGGITGWLKIAKLAADHGLKICSHGMHELHVSLLASQPHAGLLEVHSFPIDKYTTQPIKIENGFASVTDTPGIGVVFDETLLRPHLVLEYKDRS